MAVTVHALDVTLNDVLKRAEELVPRVRERASRTEQLRRVPDETMQELLDAGLFRVLQPKHWGGFELNYGEFQAKLRRDLAYSTMLCTRAVDRLASAVGAHGMLDDTPIQRAFRDVHAVANHGANNWDLQAVPYAREVLGLPPAQVR